MEYELSRHARHVLAERRIALEWLDRVLSDPSRVHGDPVDAELEHRLRAIPECGDRVLRVILKPSVRPVRVITAYFDRAKKGKV
jgi:hypothetical protein